MARGVQHDPQVKGAVIAALMAGQGVDSVAAQYNLSQGTVKAWKSQIGKELNRDQPQKETQGDEYGALLAIYVRENLITLAEQQRHFRDKDWLKRQTASELAVLHGVSTDKVIRVLEAAERAAVVSETEEDGT